MGLGYDLSNQKILLGQQMKKLNAQAGKRIAQVLTRLKNLNFSFERTNNVFELIKSASISLLSIFAVIVILLTLYKSFKSTEIKVEPLQVPASFIEKGFTPEITTVRLLDEISKINKISTSSLPGKKNISNKLPGDEISKLQSLPVVGVVDFKSIQNLIQDTFGISRSSISGEITLVTKELIPTYQVRIRSLPENILLVDLEKQGEISEVIKAAAIKLVEGMDPLAAASYYRWNKDTDNFFRMIDEALRNDDSEDDVYALLQRASSYTQRKKFDLAQDDLNQMFKKDPNFPWAINVQSYLFNEQKEYVKGLEWSTKAVQLLPNFWQPHSNLADSLVGLGRIQEAEGELLTTIKLNPTWASQYVDVILFLQSHNKNADTEQIFHKGIRKFPTYVPLLLLYSDHLDKLGRKEQALHYLNAAYKSNPSDPLVWDAYINFSGPKDSKIESEINSKQKK
jgi:tetratricopeptide (TPR) repeat protein